MEKRFITADTNTLDTRSMYTVIGIGLVSVQETNSRVCNVTIFNRALARKWRCFQCVRCTRFKPTPKIYAGLLFLFFFHSVP